MLLYVRRYATVHGYDAKAQLASGMWSKQKEYVLGLVTVLGRKYV
jgi:hypothetical protein